MHSLGALSAAAQVRCSHMCSVKSRATNPDLEHANSYMPKGFQGQQAYIIHYQIADNTTSALLVPARELALPCLTAFPQMRGQQH